MRSGGKERVRDVKEKKESGGEEREQKVEEKKERGEIKRSGAKKGECRGGKKNEA